MLPFHSAGGKSLLVYALKETYYATFSTTTDDYGN